MFSLFSFCLDNYHFVFSKDKRNLDYPSYCARRKQFLALESKLEITERKHAELCDKITAVSKVEQKNKVEIKKRLSILLADRNTFKEITVQKCWNMWRLWICNCGECEANTAQLQLIFCIV
jgi:hypothetical protein